MHMHLHLLWNQIRYNYSQTRTILWICGLKPALGYYLKRAGLRRTSLQILSWRIDLVILFRESNDRKSPSNASKRHRAFLVDVREAAVPLKSILYLRRQTERGPSCVNIFRPLEMPHPTELSLQAHSPPPSIFRPLCHPLVDEAVRDVDGFYLTHWSFGSEKAKKKFVAAGFSRVSCLYFPKARDDRIRYVCSLLTILFLVDGTKHHWISTP